DHVEENGVDQLTDDLRRGRIAPDHRFARFIRCALVSGGHRQNALGAEVYGRRERRGEPDAAVTVPIIVDAHRWKYEWQRSGRENVLDRQLDVFAAAIGFFENLDIATLNPSHVLTGRIIESDQRDGFDLSQSEVAPDSFDRGSPRPTAEKLSQKLSKRP